MKSHTSFIAHLYTLAAAQHDSIARFVAREALDRPTSEVVSWFTDLLNHGCQSGMVGSLVYYADTEAFFDLYYDEIMGRKINFEESTGIVIDIPYQFKNYLAWFAFEEVASELFDHYSSE